ncbi:MAG: hypothetical protein LC713_00575 [Actinobacteria bacterium]|nr:hypothetical protein [Actinomycetota bacterium]
MSSRRSVAVAALVLAAPLVSGCGVNFGAQTDQVYNPAAGVDARSGSVDVLNALVVSGTDGSGTVIASLVNDDEVYPDKLRGVAGAGGDSSLKVTPGGSTDIAAAGMLDLATDGKVYVRGSKVVPGYDVELTFSFQRGRSVTLKVPVVSKDDPVYADVKVPS